MRLRGPLSLFPWQGRAATVFGVVAGDPALPVGPTRSRMLLQHLQNQASTFSGSLPLALIQ